MNSAVVLREIWLKTLFFHAVCYIGSVYTCLEKLHILVGFGSV